MNTHLESNSKIAPVDPELEPNGDVAASIDLFRQAMHAVAERATERPVPADWLAPARRRHRSAQRRMVLAWSCAAALCFAVIPLSIHNPHPAVARAVVQSAPAQPQESEDALLEQVDNAIDEPVPSSLAPLTELDSWDSTTSTSTTEPSIHVHTEKTNVSQ